MSQQSNRQRERERIQRERDQRERSNGLAGGTISLFGEPIKQRHEDETTKKIKSTLPEYDKVSRMLASDPKHLIGISTSEITRIRGNKAKIEQILSEMRAFSPITGLEDVDQEADEGRLPQLTRDDLTVHPVSDEENSRPSRPNRNNLSSGNSNNIPSANNYHSSPADKPPRISHNGSGLNRKGDSILTHSSSSSSSSASSDSDSESGSSSPSSSGDASVHDHRVNESKSRDRAQSNNFSSNNNTGVGISGSGGSSGNNFHRSRQPSVAQDKETTPTVDRWDLKSFVQPSLPEKKVQDHPHPSSNSTSNNKSSAVHENSVNQTIESVVKGSGNSTSPLPSSPSSPSSESPVPSPRAKKRKNSSPPFVECVDSVPRTKAPRKSGPVVKEDATRFPDSPVTPSSPAISTAPPSSSSFSSLPHRSSFKAEAPDSAANHHDHHQPHHRLHHHQQHSQHHHEHQPPPPQLTPQDQPSHPKSRATSPLYTTQSRSRKDGHSREASPLTVKSENVSASTSKGKHSLPKRSNHKENYEEFSSKSPQHIICSINLGHLRRIPNSSSSKSESHCKEVTNVKEASSSSKNSWTSSDRKVDHNKEHKEHKSKRHKSKGDDEKSSSRSGSGHKHNRKKNHDQSPVHSVSHHKSNLKSHHREKEKIESSPIIVKEESALSPSPKSVKEVLTPNKNGSSVCKSTAPTSSSNSSREGGSSQAVPVASIGGWRDAASGAAANLSLPPLPTSTATTTTTTTTTSSADATTEQQSSDYYLSRAKALKHTADKETDRTMQLCRYLEAILFFILTGNTMEQQAKHNPSSQDPDKVQYMYRETLQLIRHISTKFAKSRSSSTAEVPSTDYKLTALSFRCQSLLYLKLYKLKSNQIRDNQKVIQNQAPEVPTSASSTSTITLPTHVYSCIQKQLFLYGYLSAAHDLWSQADYLIDKYPACKAFFGAIDLGTQAPLTLHSTLDDLVKYVRTGLNILK